MEHSKIGGSSCERYWHCPGSVNLIAKAPDQETSFAAAEGTVAHNLAEKHLKVLKQGYEEDIYKSIGLTVIEEAHEIEITEEMCDAVQLFVDVIKRDLSRFGAELDNLFVEQGFNLTEVDKDAFGTVDAALYCPFDILRVYDFKYGKGIVVEADDNKQLKFYSCGALMGRDDVSEIENVIVQPRAYHPDGPVRKVVYKRDDILKFQEELKRRVQDTKAPLATRRPGSWCKFCRAISMCEEVKQETNEVAMQDFGAVDSLPDPILLKLCNMQDRIVDFLKEVKFNLQKKAESGMEVEGWKLVKAKSNRKWKSEQRVVNEFANSKYAGKLMAPSKLKTPAQLDKIFKAERDLLLPFIEKPDKGLTMVKETDPRQAVKSSAEADFEDI